MNYDYKINKSIQFQLGCNGSYLIHVIKFDWTPEQVLEATCKLRKSKTYRATKASYTRIAELCREWANENKGRFDIWTSCPGWEFKDFGNLIKENNNDFQ
jgi:hypothetical protein